MKQICVDVGGTFTDCLVMDGDGELRRFKAPTTPSDPSVGFMTSLGHAAAEFEQETDGFLADVDLIVHGTTLATNVLLTNSGARTGLITTAGFREVIEMRRGIKNLRGSMFDQFVQPYEPLVPRNLRLGVTERMLYTGEVHVSLAEEEVEEAASRLVAAGCTSIAIGFLHSYVNPDHERRAQEIVQRVAPEALVVMSHEILPTWREFERFSTTVVSAYVAPAASTYLHKLEEQLRARGFGGSLLIMLSNGLVQTVAHCANRGVYLLTSGPAAAPSGAVEIAAAHKRTNVLEVDMGGTSFDVCLIKDGEVPRTTEAWVGEHRVAIKMVDVSTIGAGGGSIAWVDSLGLLRVGPESAGADPGPAAYGNSERPTVTDADLVLGYLPTDYFLGGEVHVDVDRARAALAALGQDLDLGPVELAEAVFETATAVMADEITEVCTNRGHDVRDFMLVAGGGAGGVHAVAIARRLGIRELIVPRVSALMSAFGMFTMDLGREQSRTRFRNSSVFDSADVNTMFEEMRQVATAEFREMAIDASQLAHMKSVEMRYEGQFHEIEIEIGDGLVTEETVASLTAGFHERHRQLYSYSMEWQPVEFLTFHLKSSARRDPPFRAPTLPEPNGDASATIRGHRQCVFAGEAVDVPVYDGTLLGPGHELTGPALIDDPTTTVLVLEGFTCSVDAHGNYVFSPESNQPNQAASHVEAAA